MATLAPTRSREPELYGVLDDNDLYSLRQRDSQYLSRYPSFHPSPRTADAAMSLHPESQGHDYTRSRKTSEVSRGQAPMPVTPLIQVNAVSADQTGQSWYDENAEAWKPTKKSNKLSSRRQHPPPPTRAQPPPPIEIISAADPDMPQPTSILIKEPAGNFARAKPPRRSAMKGQPVAGTTPASQPSPLPASAMLSPDMAAQRRMAVKQGGGHAFPPPAPSAGAASTPYWASPATTVSRFPSAPNSHRGSSTATSSVAFTSTSFYSNPSIPASAIPDVPDLPSPGSEPVENPLPRQTLFVVNADPETSESELSPVQDLRKELLPPLPLNLSGSRKAKKGSESRAPPVPPLPPQFQAPPPPSNPPPGDRSRGGPAIPTYQPSGGEQDRSVYVPPKRHSSDNRPRASHASSKPPPPSSKYSNGQARLSDSDGTSSSSDEHGRREVKRSKPTPSTAVDSEIPAEWIYPLPLTLEELFKGGKYTYRITTRLLSGEPKVQEVEIDVQAGWKSGTRIVFPAAGHERRPGVFQDMIFVVEQVHHERFARLDGGRLVCNQDIDLQDALKEGPRPKHRIVGLDGRVIEFYVPQGIIKPGTETVIKGEGMYKRSKGKVVGRGDLIVKWNICFPEQVSQAQLLRMRDIFP